MCRQTHARVWPSGPQQQSRPSDRGEQTRTRPRSKQQHHDPRSSHVHTHQTAQPTTLTPQQEAAHEDSGTRSPGRSSRRPRGRDPRRPRRLRRQHRPAPSATRSTSRAGSGVAGDSVPDDVRRRTPPGRPSRGPALPAQRLLTGLTLFTVASAGRRVRRDRQPAHRGPCRPGPCRRTADSLGALPDHDDLRRRPTQDRPGHVGCRRQPRCCSWSPSRRCTDHLVRLAGHLLDQRPHRRGRPALGRRVITRDRTPRPSVRDFDLPGGAAVVGGLAALIYAVSTTTTYGWWSVHTVIAAAVSVVLLGTFLKPSSARPSRCSRRTSGSCRPWSQGPR